MKRIVFLVIIIFETLGYCSAAPAFDYIKIVQPSGVLIIKVDTVTKVDNTNIITLDSVAFNNLKSRIVDTTDYKASIDSLSKQIAVLKSSIDSMSEDRPAFIIRILPFILLGLIVLLFIIFVVDKIRREDGLKDNVVKIVQESKRLRDWREESIPKSRNQSSIQSFKSYDREIDDLQRRIAVLEDMGKKESQPRKMMETPMSSPESAKNNMLLFGDFINNSCFSRVKDNPDDDTNFELHLIDERRASFIVYQPAYPRIVSNPSAFLQGCEKQVLGNTTVSIIREGTAMKEDNGKWRIVDELKVEIR